MDELEQLKIKTLFDESIAPMREELQEIGKTVTALYHEVYGVQGNNGMKKDVHDLTECTMKLKLQMAKWGGGIAAAIIIINIIIKLI